jgi:hypothetical protein
MANYSSTRLQRGYVQKEPAWGTTPNAGGVATLAGADAFLFTDLNMQDTQAVEPRPDKTGSLSVVKGLSTRRSGTWSMRASLAGGGTADVPPDLGPFFEALLGKQTINAGTSVVYDPDDVDTSLSIWDFNRPASMAQRLMAGAIAQSFRMNFGQTYADVEFSGEGKCVTDSARLAGASTEEKGGLNAFPVEPVTPVTVGNAVTGYKGILTLDAQTYATLRSGSLQITVERELQKTGWDSDLPTGVASGVRRVRCDLMLDDDDSVALTALIWKAYANTAVDFSIQLGKTAGAICLVALKNIVLPKPVYDYSGKRRGIAFNGCEAAATTITDKDETKITFK